MIARRTERSYLIAALALAGTGLLDLIDHGSSGTITTYRIFFVSVVCLVSSLFLFQSYRFNRIRRLLEMSNSAPGE